MMSQPSPTTVIDMRITTSCHSPFPLSTFALTTQLQPEYLTSESTARFFNGFQMKVWEKSGSRESVQI